MTGLLSYLDWFPAALALSLPQKVVQDDPAPVLPQQYACVCVYMNVFKRNKFLVKVGLG